jgi:hypothetical protein
MNPKQIGPDTNEEDTADEDIMIQAPQLRSKRNKSMPKYLKDYVVPIMK